MCSLFVLLKGKIGFKLPGLFGSIGGATIVPPVVTPDAVQFVTRCSADDPKNPPASNNVTVSVCVPGTSTAGKGVIVPSTFCGSGVDGCIRSSGCTPYSATNGVAPSPSPTSVMSGLSPIKPVTAPSYGDWKQFV